MGQRYENEKERETGREKERDGETEKTNRERNDNDNLEDGREMRGTQQQRKLQALDRHADSRKDRVAIPH